MKAFPTPTFSINDEARVTAVGGEGGMDLRDYFAAKAMQSMLANETLHATTIKIAREVGIAEQLALSKMSFAIADAMMDARQS
jgi:hypothetical protein